MPVVRRRRRARPRVGAIGGVAAAIALTLARGDRTLAGGLLVFDDLRRTAIHGSSDSRRAQVVRRVRERRSPQVRRPFASQRFTDAEHSSPQRAA
jgi:hypothetical protein